jgi:hypothetical protein
VNIALDSEKGPVVYGAVKLLHGRAERRECRSQCDSTVVPQVLQLAEVALSKGCDV